MLIATLVLVGGGTFLIGLLPGYATIGIWAPVLLLFLRLVQGFGAGAEYGGAVIRRRIRSARQARMVRLLGTDGCYRWQSGLCWCVRSRNHAAEGSVRRMGLAIAFPRVDPVAGARRIHPGQDFGNARVLGVCHSTQGRTCRPWRRSDGIHAISSS
jgi:hypothetical protein